MKILSIHFTFFLAISLLFLTTACHSTVAEETTVPEETFVVVETVSIPAESTTVPTETETTAPPVPVVELTEEEKALLLKLGMAERGSTECTECIALVMRSVLNRVEAGHFSSIRSTIYAQDQYLPVSDGSFDTAEPNEYCYEALEMILYGWDESQGAMFYEWCEGESWHSKNLHLLLQHCDTRFYN